MLDVLTLDQLRVFVTVAESGSFRSGAARLFRVQSAISHAIANLEAELGVALFDRGGHRPVLTAEGHALLANARDILLRIDVMRARARSLGEGVELELSLTVDTLFPTAVVGKALSEMRVAYPGVSIRIAVEPLGGPPTALIEKRSTLFWWAKTSEIRELLSRLSVLSSKLLWSHPTTRWVNGQRAKKLDCLISPIICRLS
jgi:DNA-binding transcriptional LysR family regulator